MALSRMIDGKRFYFDMQFHNQERALARAERWRKRGVKARTIKVDELTWEVWTEGWW